MNPALEELETLIAVTIHGGFSGDPRVSVPLSALERWRKALAVLEEEKALPSK